MILTLFLNSDDYHDAGSSTNPLDTHDVFDFHVSLTYDLLSTLNRGGIHSPDLKPVLGECALYNFIGKVIKKVSDNHVIIDCDIPILIQGSHLQLGDIVEGYGFLYCNSLYSLMASKYRMHGKVINIIKHSGLETSKPIYLIKVEIINACENI